MGVCVFACTFCTEARAGRKISVGWGKTAGTRRGNPVRKGTRDAGDGGIYSRRGREGWGGKKKRSIVRGLLDGSGLRRWGFKSGWERKRYGGCERDGLVFYIFVVSFFLIPSISCFNAPGFLFFPLPSRALCFPCASCACAFLFASCALARGGSGSNPVHELVALSLL